MITPEGRVKVLDFGLAKLLEPAQASADATSLGGLTEERALLGTPAFMSPEQAEGRKLYVQQIGAGSPLRLTSDPKSDYNPVLTWKARATRLSSQLHRREHLAHRYLRDWRGHRVIAGRRHRLDQGGHPPTGLARWRPCGLYQHPVGNVGNLGFGSRWLQRRPAHVPRGDGDRSASLVSRWHADRVHVRLQKDQFDIFVVPSGGGRPRNLTSHPAFDHVPSFSRDGKWIYFSSTRSGQYQVWKVPISGGEPVQMTYEGGWVSFESADGGDLYFTPTPAVGAQCWTRC